MKCKYFIFIIILCVLFAGIYIFDRGRVMTDIRDTDAEFAELWSNFIDKEVKPHGNLDARTRHLAVLAANIAAQGLESYKVELKEALSDGIKPEEIKEVLYHAVPYAGFSKVYDFILATNEVFNDLGISLPLKPQGTVNAGNRLSGGIKAQSAIFGAAHIEAMRSGAPAELKHIQDYLSANCFGDYYTRGAIDLKTRELLTFVILVSLGGADSQAKAHAQGNINIGNDRLMLIDTVTQILPYIGYPRSLNAIAAINAAAGK